MNVHRYSVRQFGQITKSSGYLWIILGCNLMLRQFFSVVMAKFSVPFCRVYLSYPVPKHYITMREKSLEILNSAKVTSSYYAGKLMKIGTMEKLVVFMDFFRPILSRL